MQFFNKYMNEICSLQNNFNLVTHIVIIQKYCKMLETEINSFLHSKVFPYLLLKVIIQWNLNEKATSSSYDLFPYLHRLI